MRRKKPVLGAESRRRDLQRFIDDYKIKVSPWAKAAGISEGTVRNFLAKRSETLTQATVDALARAAGVAVATIFKSSAQTLKGKKARGATLKFMAKPVGALGAKDLPIAVKGPRGRLKPKGFTARPDYLRGIEAAYALPVDDSSMSPAFEPGWLAYVDPTALAKAGDNVVAVFANGATALRRLVRTGKAGTTLRQFNPRIDSAHKPREIAVLHCVAGVRYRR